MKNIKLLKEEFQNNQHNDLLKKIYNEPTLINHQKFRYINALHQYESYFGDEDVEIYSAPGRSEIGGNHTDHQLGTVLAASIHLDAVAVAGYNDSRAAEIISEGYGSMTVSLNDLEPRNTDSGNSIGLLRGILKGFIKEGFDLRGFHMYITSDVTNGSGLSSSAAFEVLLGTVISGLFHQMKINPIKIAQIAQYAENVYFGKPCGLMDQIACSIGGLIHIDFKKKETPLVQKADMNFDNFLYSLCIVDTGCSHADLTEEYASIPAEMQSVAKLLGKSVLREVEEQEFICKIPFIREKLSDRHLLRALHFFHEEKRVANQFTALQKGDYTGFLKLVRESGISSFCYLQNVYNSTAQKNQGVSVALAISENILNRSESYGVSRVHGGGFAGTIQAFVSNDFAESYQKQMDAVFGSNAAKILKIRQCGGCRIV